jgi:hypothetical protein
MMRFPIVPSAVGFLIIGLASTQSVNAACERTSAPVIDTDSATASLFDPPNPRSRDTQHETLNRSLVSPFAQNSYFQNRLGVMFARGNGVAKNERLASQLFRRLALDGYTPAMVNLGTMYELGSAGRQDHRRAGLGAHHQGRGSRRWHRRFNHASLPALGRSLRRLNGAWASALTCPDRTPY